jgi:hypothetical protein
LSFSALQLNPDWSVPQHSFQPLPPKNIRSELGGSLEMPPLRDTSDTPAARLEIVARLAVFLSDKTGLGQRNARHRTGNGATDDP